ncbi:MAG: hypothetical protein AAGI90_02470 [Chlamydiota bacterium]
MAPTTHFFQSPPGHIYDQRNNTYYLSQTESPLRGTKVPHIFSAIFQERFYPVTAPRSLSCPQKPRKIDAVESNLEIVSATISNCSKYYLLFALPLGIGIPLTYGAIVIFANVSCSLASLAMIWGICCAAVFFIFESTALFQIAKKIDTFRIYSESDILCLESFEDKKPESRFIVHDGKRARIQDLFSSNIRFWQYSWTMKTSSMIWEAIHSSSIAKTPTTLDERHRISVERSKDL